MVGVYSIAVSSWGFAIILHKIIQPCGETLPMAKCWLRCFQAAGFRSNSFYSKAVCGENPAGTGEIN